VRKEDNIGERENREVYEVVHDSFYNALLDPILY
jgi:hypothetical protein